MPEIIHSPNKHIKNFDKKFLFVNNSLRTTKLRQEVELCVVKTDFNVNDLKFIKKLKSSNPHTEIWVSSDNLSRENVLSANKLGIKTVITYPFDNKMVSAFFDSKNCNFYADKVPNSHYDCSCIANAKVMIVDDNLMNVELLKELLSKFNIQISCFLKSKEAYKAALSEKFDLFLLDIMMPEMSGFELAKKIRDTHLNKNSSIMFISALSDAHNKIKGYDLGSCAYIEKPFEINVIKSQIFNVLKSQQMQASLESNKESFLATIAHDLKTPINAGINALNILLKKDLGKLEDEQQEIVEDLLNSTKFMQDMVENILCKNKIENNRIVLAKQVYSLKEVIEHCIELTKYILEPKKQQIELKCNVTNTLVPLDFLEMQRAIHNLIANASEYSPVQSKIKIEIFKEKNKIGFFVQDFGKGIGIEHQKDVFAQYISFAKKYKRVGSGLGLYITKNIIEAHRGEITLNSKIDYGTKITVLLPSYIKD